MIWRPKFHKRIAQLLDYFSIYTGFILSFTIWENIVCKFNISASSNFMHNRDYIILTIVLAAIYVLILEYFAAYSAQRFTSLKKEYTIVLKASSVGILIGLLIIYLFNFIHIPRLITIIAYITVFGILSIQKTIIFFIADFIRKNGKNRKSILIIGTGTICKQFINKINSNIGWGLDIIGLLSCEKENLYKSYYGYPVIGSIIDFEYILKVYNPEEVIITLSLKNFNNIKDVIDTCEREGVQVRLISDFFGYITKHIRLDEIYGLRIISFYMTKQSEIEQIIKRIFDVCFSIFALVIFLPFFLIASVGIILTDGFPVFYNWNVIGLNKKPFKSWKFRTMIKDADQVKQDLFDQNEMVGPVFKMENDPRILPFGRWLRKWSIDELPQFLSVLIGHMSIVGPRPAGPHELDLYQSWQRRKLSVKPGLTCLWQVNGRNKIRSFNEWVTLDLNYIDNWSLWLDLKIFIKTIFIVIRGTGK